MFDTKTLKLRFFLRNIEHQNNQLIIFWLNKGRSCSPYLIVSSFNNFGKMMNFVSNACWCKMYSQYNTVPMHGSCLIFLIL